ncbi:hypothetical protein B0H14DRAFT_2741245 [Mycena olivaceomarginata]|nr:hypothetical protein B0H14DRAFT_2741245 [Mycena olivaceomarginata]
MLSIASIFLSVLLAGASPARRVTCSPQILGTNISITNGPLEAGFSSTGSTLVSQPISQTVPEFAVAASNFPGEFTLLSTGRCLNISLSTTTPVGSAVTLGNCQAIGSSINIYIA